MPTYDYRCEGCEHEFEAFQRISEDRLTDCPKCGEAALRRLVGRGAGIIFRGSGFYETDYKRTSKAGDKSEKKQEGGEKSDSAGSKSEGSTDKSGGSSEGASSASSGD